MKFSFMNLLTDLCVFWFLQRIEMLEISLHETKKVKRDKRS